MRKIVRHTPSASFRQKVMYFEREVSAPQETIRGFRMIVEGECDALPEQAFYMVGPIEEAVEKTKTIQ